MQTQPESPTPVSSEPEVLGYDTTRVLTIPNLLSLARLVGVPLFFWMVVRTHADWWAVLVLALAGASDWLDGFLARRWNQRSRVGQMLDPVADRLYILAILVGLAIRDIIPWWFVALLVARDVVLALLVPLLKTRGYTSLPVHFIGKAGTFCLLYAFPMVLLGSHAGALAAVMHTLGWAFAIWGTGLYWWAGLLYVGQTVELMRRTPHR